jgi:hypothetical protein
MEFFLPTSMGAAGKEMAYRALFTSFRSFPLMETASTSA